MQAKAQTERPTTPTRLCAAIVESAFTYAQEDAARAIKLIEYGFADAAGAAARNAASLYLLIAERSGE